MVVKFLVTKGMWFSPEIIGIVKGHQALSEIVEKGLFCRRSDGKTYHL